MTAVVLALASSFTWGISDFFGGLQSRRRPLVAVLVVTQLGGLVLILAVVAARGEGPPDAGGWIAWAAGSSLLGISGLAAFYRGLATGPMGVVAPIASAAAIVPLTVGLATGDRPSALQGVGVAVAIAGVVLASREEDAESGRGTGIAAGAGLAIIAALGFGGFFVGLDRASDADVLYAVLVARIVALAALAVAAFVTRTAIPTRRRDLAVLVPIGFGDTGANLLFALATTYGLLSLVGVLSSLYPVVTVLLARVVLHERLRAVQRVGAAGALAGAALISAG